MEFGQGTARVQPARASRREAGKDRRGGFSSRGTAQNEEKSRVTLIAMISGGLVLIGLVALLASSFSGGRTSKRPRAEDDLPPQEYVRLADEQMRMGNKMKAHDYLLKASEGWQRIGQEEEARQCNMRAYSIGKDTTINDYRR